jgi:hypothetical protein
LHYRRVEFLRGNRRGGLESDALGEGAGTEDEDAFGVEAEAMEAGGHGVLAELLAQNRH